MKTREALWRCEHCRAPNNRLHVAIVDLGISENSWTSKIVPLDESELDGRLKIEILQIGLKFEGT